MCTEMRIDMCIDVYIDLRIDLCIDAGVDLHVGICVDMCIGMCIDVVSRMPPATSTTESDRKLVSQASVPDYRFEGSLA